MKTVILGGTSGMGRAVAQQLAERGDPVFLLGRDTSELERSAADLSARNPKRETVGFAPCDLED
ncbi:MAG: SDR family NAD(P)-dependent oxidoreductase, partial [Polyangiaceae bacterium]|nr:SDR family NAD(P)-dependent oxidoreductase [Polyangiaceae bacterium]